MKLSWLTSSMMVGLFAIILSGIVLFRLGSPEDMRGYSMAAFLIASGLFAAGLMIVIVTIWEYFLGSSGKPNYIYHPNTQQIFVRFSSTPFQIERNGTRVWVRMVLDAPYSSRQIIMSDTKFAGLKKDHFTGKEGDSLFCTADGQKLHLTRETLGIKIWWEEENNPWKVVEEK